MKRAVIIIFAVLIIVSAFLFLNDYRLTPEGAARANPFIGRDSALVLRTNASVGETFAFEVEDYYVMTAPYRWGFLWRSNSVCSTQSIDDKNDPVRTLGLLNISDKTQSGAVWIVRSKDSRVAAIKVDTKYANFDENGIAILNLREPLLPVPSDVTAIDGGGIVLYIYGDNDGMTNIIDLAKTKWYKA